jgi:hypothetical protein
MRKEHQEVPSLAYRESGRVHRSCLAKLPSGQLPHPHGPCDQRWHSVHRDSAVCKPRGSRAAMQRVWSQTRPFAACDTSITRDVNMLEERAAANQRAGGEHPRTRHFFSSPTQRKHDKDSATFNNEFLFNRPTKSVYKKCGVYLG